VPRKAWPCSCYMLLRNPIVHASEVRVGRTVQHIVYENSGNISDGEDLKVVQIGCLVLGFSGAAMNFQEISASLMCGQYPPPRN